MNDACAIPAPNPADEKEWLACEKDADCTSVQLGCYYWQPVSKAHAEDMRTKYMSACTASVFPGPQPSLSCVGHVCVNDPYTVKYWNQQGTPQDALFGIRFVDRRIVACLHAANMEANSIGSSYVELRDSFVPKIDGLIHQGKFHPDEPLDRVIESAISCEDVLAACNTMKAACLHEGPVQKSR
jgi:hypothetical protein